MCRRFRCLLGVLALLAIASLTVVATRASARNYAVLVGVNGYDEQVITTLQAPGNDVRLVFNWLLKRKDFDINDIRVLADALPTGKGEASPVHLEANPTAAAIRQSLDAMVEKLSANDVLVFYFSGHGVKVPQARPVSPHVHFEVDGHDEVLLAKDAGKLDRSRRVLPGGIVDDEIDSIARRVQAKGGFFWLILDACHAGGATRGRTDVIEKTVVRERLDIPPVAASADRPPADSPRELAGGSVAAFLASAEDRSAIELPVPGDAGRSYSLFTYNLIGALESATFDTYRQLGRAVRQRIEGLSASHPLPAFEGEGLDQMILRTGSIPGMLARLKAGSGELIVEAGALHGYGRGTILALSRQAGEVIGYAEVTSVEFGSSTAVPRPYGSSPAPKPNDLDGTLVARVERATADWRYKVSRPPERDCDPNVKTPPRGLAKAREVVAELAARLDGKLQLVASASSEADLHLCVLGDKLLFLPPDAELKLGRRPVPGLELSADRSAKDLAHALELNLLRGRKHQMLLRFAGLEAEKPLAKSVEVKLRLVRDPSDFGRVLQREASRCLSFGTPVKPEQGEEFRQQRLTQCDRVSVEIVNSGDKPVDVTVLFLDSKAGISKLDRESSMTIVRDYPKNSRHLQPPVRIVTWCNRSESNDEHARACASLPETDPTHYATVGVERIAVIIAERTGSDARVYYDRLVQPGFEQVEPNAINRGGTKSDIPLADDIFRDFLNEQEGATRSANPLDRRGGTTIKIFPLDIVPPGELGARR